VVRVCGRYASSWNPLDLGDHFAVERTDPVSDDAQQAGTGSSGRAAAGLPPDWNVAPTKTVYAVLERCRPDDLDARPVRRLRPVRWGLVPSWARDPKAGNSMINARVETAATKPAYRRALAARRCLLPADGYYEWGAGPDGTKTPYFIRPRAGGVLAMAGLYELWRDPHRPHADPTGWLWSAVIITTRAVGELRQLHDRMPVFAEPEHYAAWLDSGRTDPVAARALLAPAPPGRLVAHPVSPAVGNVANNGPQLAAPLPAFP
jgi:putative SOS response-associated peptidase YedK